MRPFFASKPTVRWDMWNLTDVALHMKFKLRLIWPLPEIGQKYSMRTVCKLWICPKSVKILPPKLFKIFLTCLCETCNLVCVVVMSVACSTYARNRSKFFHQNCLKYFSHICVKYVTWFGLWSWVWHVRHMPEIGQILPSKHSNCTLFVNVPDVILILGFWHMHEIGQKLRMQTVRII